MPTFLKAAQFEPQSPSEHVEGFSLILPLENRSGYVFALAYISKKHPDNHILLQLTNDHVHRLAGSFGQDANAQHRFEQFLGSLNETLAQTVRDGRFLIPIHQFHATVGIICDDRMFLSGTGELAALFLHHKASQRYQIFNLFRGIQTEQALPTWEKTFAVVLDGDLEPGDVFCVSQRDLQRHIPQEELNSVLTALPPKSAAEKIRQYFGAHEGVLLLIIKAESTNTSIPESYAKPLSDVSIDSFVRAQDETAKLLADQKPDIAGFLKTRIIQWYKKMTDRSRLLSDLRRGEPAIKTVLTIGRSFLHAITKSLRRLGKSFVFIFRTIGNKEKRDSLIESLPHTKQRLKEWGRHRWNTLSPHNKRFSLILIILIGLLTIGIILLSQSRTQSEQQRAFEQKYNTIQETIDRAGGALIYKDENQARALYQQAKTLIDQLPKNKPSYNESADKLSKEIETAMNELRHVVTIPNPALIAHIENGTDDTSGVRLVRSGSLLYSLDVNQRVWQINPATKESKLLTPSAISPAKIIDVTEDNGNLIVLDVQNHLLSIDTKTGTATPLSVSDLSQGTNTALLSYARRLYLLQQSTDGHDAQILKFNRSGNDYGTGTSWISSKTQTLPNAQALTIDGSLFVLKQNGSITRFQNGAEVGWQLGIVDPAIQNATRLWTDTSSAYLYTLDSATHRLIVYKKDTGVFVVQYTSDAFQHLTDFVVDEKAKTIYLLSGTDLFTISAGHLNGP